MRKKKVLIPIAVVAVGTIVAVFAMGLLSGNEIAPNGSNSTPESNSTTPREPDERQGNWITPGKVFVENCQQGEAAEYYVQIHNSNDHDATFFVEYRYPDALTEGYSKPSEDTPYWLWVSDKKRPVIPAHETYTVIIRLTVPKSATVPADKWEFWIGVIDQSQTGNVITELAQRWLITMG